MHLHRLVWTLAALLGLAGATGLQAGTFTDDFAGGINSTYWSVQSSPGQYDIDTTAGVKFTKTLTAPTSDVLVALELDLTQVAPMTNLGGTLYPWSISIDLQNNNASDAISSVVFDSFSITAAQVNVPEPASFGLLALGGVTMMRARRR